MSGTPGTINNAQAKSGCQGVEVWRNAGRVNAAEVLASPNAHAMIVLTNAAKAILTYGLESLALRNIRNLNPNIAAIEA